MVAGVLRDSWTTQRLRDLGVPGLEALEEEDVLLLLNDHIHHQIHCKDFHNTQQTRHFLRLPEAISYVASMISRQVTAVVMGYSIRAGKIPMFHSVEAIARVCLCHLSSFSASCQCTAAQLLSCTLACTELAGCA